jgi:predicted XRE-type DNA-binding protein
MSIYWNCKLFQEGLIVKSKKSVFPDDKTLKRVRDQLSSPDYLGGNLALPAGASEVDRAKYQVCQLLAKYKREHGWKQKEIAEKLGVDESRISDLLRGKIEGFTLDRLLDYAQKLHPRLRVEITAA